jgi:hypothetical protein
MNLLGNASVGKSVVDIFVFMKYIRKTRHFAYARCLFYKVFSKRLLQFDELSAKIGETPAGKASQARPRRALTTEEARGLPAESESIFAFINNKVYEKSL